MTKFMMNHSFESRKKEATRIIEKYPDRIPIIIEPANVKNNELPDIDKKKYLVPKDLIVGQFMYVIRKRIKLSSEKAIYLFVGNIIPPSSGTLSSLYYNYKNEDGFLYITYSGENTFG